MSYDNLEPDRLFAQDGASVSPVPTNLNVETPLIDRLDLEDKFSGYTAPSMPDPLPTYRGQDNVYLPPASLGGGGQSEGPSPLKSLENFLLTKSDIKPGGSVARTLEEVSSNRFDNFVPGDYNNEDAYAQGQGWPSKMVNGVGKGLLLTGTTFLQGTVGLVNGLARWAEDGKFSSFYNNEFNKQLDELNKKAEDALPNFYTDVEKNASWYSPSYFMTGNFLWDGVVKNMGFAAGAYLTGGVYSAALKGLAALPGASRLLSMGRAAEAVAASEEALVGLDKGSQAYGKIKQLSDSYLRQYNILDKGHRAVVAGLSTTGEAGFEAYHNLNDFRNKKIEEYKATHGGVDPTGADLQKINQSADDVGNASFLTNVALLSATNYIQFPKILGSSYKAEKGILNNMTREIGDITTDAAGKFAVKAGGNRVLNTINAIRPYVFSTSEAFEEGAQFAVQMGTQDYYNKKYNNQATDWVDAVSTGIKETLTTNEGAKNILIGGLSGALMMGRSTYQERRDQKANTAAAVEQFNKFRLSDFTKETIDSVNRGTTLQEERERLLKEGNLTESKDRETDYIVNYLTPRIKYGRYDLVKAEIEDHRRLASTDEGFNQLVTEGKALPTDTKEAYSQRLTNLEQTANNMKSLYQSLSLRYGGKVNEDGTPTYPSDIISKMIYAATKVSDYDNRITGLTPNVLSPNYDVNQIIADVLAGETESFDKAVASIQEDTTINDDEKEDRIQDLDDLSFMALKRSKFLQEYNDLKAKPQDFAETTATEEDEAAVPTTKEIIKIKTKRGDRDIEVGTEYFIGQDVEYDEKGKEVYRAPRITILGQNEDGTIKVKDSDGNIHDLKPSTIARYNLGKVESTLKNKKAKFYMENWNTVYEFNFGKDKGGKQKGRITYDPETKQMLFVYTNKKGERKEIEVTGDQFIPNKKKGFTEPMIKAVGELTAVQKQAQDEFTAEKDDRTEAKREARLKILTELFDDLSKRQDSTTSLIEQKKKQLEKISEDLAELRKEIEQNSVDKRSKKVTRFKASAKAALDNTIKLSRLQTQLEDELVKLEDDIQEIEFNMSYVMDVADNIDEYATNFYDFKNELEDDILNLEMLQEKTKDQMRIVSKLLKSTQAAIDSAIKMLTDLIQKFESKYPNVPRLMGQDWVDFLKQNPNFLKLKPTYKEELQNLDDIISVMEDGEINPNETRIADLEDHLSVMLGEFEELSKLIDAKYMVLNKFEEIAARHKAAEAESERLQKDESMRSEFLGTNDTSIQNTHSDDNFEASARKDDLEAVGSTIAVTRGNKGEKVRENHARANRFGFNFNKFENKNKIRGVVVTAKTQDALIPGLMDYLTDGGTAKDAKGNIVDPNKIIALVMVQDNEDGTMTLVGENGQPLEGDAMTSPVTSAIYQVFPLEELEANYKNEKGEFERASMFRSSTPEEVRTGLKAQYAAWRQKQLARETLADPQTISPSFGIVEYVEEWDDVAKKFVRDTSAVVSVEETGMLEDEALLTRDVLTVATNSEQITYGKTTFESQPGKSVLGRVFVKVSNGLIKVFNRKLNRSEAEVIYDVMLQAAKNAQADGTFKTPETQQLFKWLKSVIYWGIPRNMQTGERKKPGFNSVWFETVTENNQDVTRLYMSGNGADGFAFTPMSMEERKLDIIAILEGMYHNTNSTMVNNSSYNVPYYQITGINKEGKPILKEWVNYQTYLLSSEGRTKDEIPLFTQVRPLKDENQPNKKGIYFTLDDTFDEDGDFKLPEIKSVVTNTPAPTQQPAKVDADSQKSTLEKLKAAINSEEDLNGLMDSVYQIIDEREFLNFQENYDQNQLNKDLEQQMLATNGEEALVYDIISRYTLTKFIDSKIAELSAKPAQAAAAPAATTTVTYNLEGTAENNVKVGKHGNIKFTINARKFIDTNRNEGLGITFEADVVNSIMATPDLMKDRPEEVSEVDYAKGLIYSTILQKIRPQLDAYEASQKVPAANAGQTTFDLSGVGVNTIQVLSYGKVDFTINGKQFNENQTTFNIDFKSHNAEAVAKLTEEKGITPQEAMQQLGNEIYKEIYPQLEALKIPNDPPLGPTEFVPTQEEEAPAAETSEEVETPSTPPPPTAASKFSSRQRTQVDEYDDEALRVALLDQSTRFEGEKWQNVEAWLKENFKGVPVFRVKNIIRATNGKQAWGMFHKGAIYVYENAEVGTVYHEVFEAVWKMFATPEEKANIYKEFRKRKGTFQDRENMYKPVAYKDATDYQIKEQLAEEFRDFVLTGDTYSEQGVKKSWIAKLFSDIVNFIKEFFVGKNAQNNTQQLFDRIGTGYYAMPNPYTSKLAYANAGIIDIEDAKGDMSSEFRVKNIDATQLHEIIEHMTFVTLRDISKEDRSIFELEKPTAKEVYDKLHVEVLKSIGHMADVVESNFATHIISEEEQAAQLGVIGALYDNVDAEWNDIVARHKEKLKVYGIEFDENDAATISDDDASGKGDWQDARKIDSFRKSNPAIKILLASLAESYTTTEKVNGVDVKKFRFKKSSVGGAILMPLDRVFITLKNQLYDSVNPNDMLNRLQAIAKGNPSYEALYKRITGLPSKDTADISKLSENQLPLLSAFWKTMKSQNADALSVFIMPTGDVVVSDSTLTSAAKQSKRNMFNSMVDKLKNDKKFFTYDVKTGRYYATDFAKNAQLNSADLNTYVKFLSNLGIDFKISDIKKNLTDNQRDQFVKAVNGLKTIFTQLSEKNKSDSDETESAVARGIVTLSEKTLGVSGNMFQLGIIKAIIEDPDFESTYFNINGERTQTYIGPNATSSLHNVLSKLKNLNELDSNPEYSQYKYLQTDVFTKGSVMLKSMFTDKGTRKENTEEFMKAVYIDGTLNETNGKKKESSKLSYKERLVQEINLNLNGVYLNLVPGDASIEWAIKMHEDNSAFINDDSFYAKKHYEIFKQYFISEVNLARDNRTVVGDRSAKDLRFFKAILADNTQTEEKKINRVHNMIVSEENKNVDPEQLYKNYEKQINAALDKFIAQEATATQDALLNFGVVYVNDLGQLVTDGISFGKEIDLTLPILNEKLKVLSTNYMIANIEMHKMLYSDPYQYEDELKRIKNFNSPRQSLISGSPEYSQALDTIYNKGYKKGDISHTDMNRDYFRSVVIAEVLSENPLEGYYKTPYKETDGGGYITSNAHRVFKIRSGEWTPENELQWKYDNAYEKIVRGEGLSKEEKQEQGLVLSSEELAFNIRKKTDTEGRVRWVGNNPSVKSTYTPIKPIVSGNKADGRDYNDVVLDKFALMPLSFRILNEMDPKSNAVKLYKKMQKENIDYAVYPSSRKVGVEVISPLYNQDGSFSETPFETAAESQDPYAQKAVSNIPFAIMGVQSEVPSKDSNDVTQGSQITKLVTLDFLEGGMPIDFNKDNDNFDNRLAQWIKLSESEKIKASPIYKEVRRNKALLEAKIDEGFKILLKKLGMKKVSDGFQIENKDKLVNTLQSEILKREVNDNLLDAFAGFKQGQVVLEATPAYQQIRNILYSIADKNVVSPKISGGLKVQIPSTLFEGTRAEAKLVSTKKGKVPVYSSDVLEFYKDEDGKRVCEIMVARWFESDMSDDQLLDYLNNTDEGKKILEGVGFRIPTQKQNSIDSFRIAKFLPKEFGDSVVIPSALVNKSGSDFDIDKLSIYLKNTFKSKGDIKLVPFFGIGEQARQKFAEMYDRGELLNDAQYKELQAAIKEFNEGVGEGKIIEAIFGDLGKFTDEDIIEDFLDSINEVGLKETIVDRMYKKSLENEYIQSLQNLVSHEENFQNLVKPNSADQMKDLNDEINVLLGIPKSDYSSVGNMMKRSFMSNLRHSFVTGKYAIGIAAVNQTNHAQNQRAVVVVDFDKLEGKTISEEDKHFLKLNGGDINFKEYNSVVVNNKKYPTLSKIKSANGKDFISDVIGQFIDGYVDIAKGAWIMELGANPNVASTWLFLVKLGVPINTVGYFMNQPIIKDYLKMIQSKGYSYLFIDDYVSEMKLEYLAKKDEVFVDGVPSDQQLRDMIGKSTSQLDDQQLSQQSYILDEFLKYAKMAEHSFLVTQGSNFDTATLNDPYLVFKKMLQLMKGRDTIFSSFNEKLETIPAIDAIIDQSFIGVLKNAMLDIRNAFSEVLISDKPTNSSGGQSVRTVLEKVLTPYVNMGDRQFIKISQKAVSDLFDWAVQTDRKINRQVQKILLGSDTEQSAAKQIIDFKEKVMKDPKHPLYNNLILKSLTLDSGSKLVKDEYELYDKRVGQNVTFSRNVIDMKMLLTIGYNKIEANRILRSVTKTPDNLSIVGLGNKVYDQNLIIYGFNELKDKLSSEDAHLYGKLVRLAVLQSGLTNSPIAFTNLLPYEDFKELYNQTLSKLENMPNLRDFYDLNVFQRNNWSNTDIVPFRKGKLTQSKNNPLNWYYPEIQRTIKPVQKLVDAGAIPRTIVLPLLSREGSSDVITYSWEDRINKNQRIKARRTGDRSHINKGLFKKVYTVDEEGNPIPLVQITEYKDRTYANYVYKMINAWGDSFRANEFYDKAVPGDATQTTSRASIIDNGYLKVQEQFDQNNNQISSAEVEDTVIDMIYEGKLPVVASINNEVKVAKGSSEIVDIGNELPMLPENIEKIKGGTKNIINRSSRFRDGIYKLPDGTMIKLEYKGEGVVEYIGDSVIVSANDTNISWNADEYARGEGFNDFNDFIRNNSFSQKFINGEETRFIYSVNVISLEKPEGVTQEEWDKSSEEEKLKIIEC